MHPHGGMKEYRKMKWNTSENVNEYLIAYVYELDT